MILKFKSRGFKILLIFILILCGFLSLKQKKQDGCAKQLNSRGGQTVDGSSGQLIKRQLPSISGQRLEEFKSNVEKSNEFADVAKFLAPKFEQQRKFIFEKINSFVLNFPVDEVFASNVNNFKFDDEKYVSWSELFENYCKDFLKNSASGKFNVLKREEFEKFVESNKKDVVQVFKAVDLNEAARIKAGEIDLEGGILGAIHAGPGRAAGNGIYVSENCDRSKKADYCDYEISSGKKPAEILKFALNLKNDCVIDFDELKNLVAAACFENYLPILAEQQLAIKNFQNQGFEVGIGLDLLDRFEAMISEWKKFSGFDYFNQPFGLRGVAFKNELKKQVEVEADEEEENELFLNYMCDINKILISSVLCNLGLVAKLIGKDVVKIEYGAQKKGKVVNYCVLNLGVLNLCLN